MPPRGYQQTDGRVFVYDTLVAYIDEHGYPPSMRELADIIGYSSRSSVHHHLHALADEGRIRIGPSRSALQIALVRD